MWERFICEASDFVLKVGGWGQLKPSLEENFN